MVRHCICTSRNSNLSWKFSDVLSSNFHSDLFLSGWGFAMHEFSRSTFDESFAEINLAVKLSSRDKNSQSLLARRSCSWWAKLLWVVVIIVLFGLEQSLKGCFGQLVLQINLWSFWGSFLDCQFHCSKSDFSLNCSHRHRLDVLFWCCAQVLLSKCHQHVSRANLDLSSFWQVTFYMLYMHASSRFWRLYNCNIING